MSSPLPSNWEEARLAGTRRYFTGKPCAAGHTSERYTSNAMCVECLALRNKAVKPKRIVTEVQREKARLRSKRYHTDNRDGVLEKMKARNTAYYAAHADEIKARSATYQRENLAARNAYKSEWASRRAKQDPQFAALLLMRKFVSRTLERIKQSRREQARTIAILGYTQAEFVAHIEGLFVPGMTWQNHGEWEVDHRRPLSSFILLDTNEFRRANSLHNLQPLWQKSNRAKSNKWDGQLTLLA